MAVTARETAARPRLAELAKASLVFLLVPALTIAFLELHKHQQLFVPSYMLLVVALGAVCYKRLPASSFRAFCLYVLAFALFNGLRTYADATGMPVSYSYPIDIDASLFGVTPTNWLQGHFFRPGHVDMLDRAAVAVYLSFFVGHFVLGGYLLWRRPDLLPQHAGAVTATLFAGLALYFLLPTAPPWLAAQSGHLTHVFRITQDVTNDVSSNLYARGAYVAGTNDIAAMPSLHTALTAIVAMGLWRLNRVAGVCGWLYVVAMGLSLMYLGEHYFADVAAGVLVAVGCWRLVCRMAPRAASLPATALRDATPAAAIRALGHEQDQAA